MRNGTNLETPMNQYNALKQALKPPKGMARSKTLFPRSILTGSVESKNRQPQETSCKSLKSILVQQHF
jgi:hypothetical protein